MARYMQSKRFWLPDVYCGSLGLKYLASIVRFSGVGRIYNMWDSPSLSSGHNVFWLRKASEAISAHLRLKRSFWPQEIGYGPNLTIKLNNSQHEIKCLPWPGPSCFYNSDRAVAVDVSKLTVLAKTDSWLDRWLGHIRPFLRECLVDS